MREVRGLREAGIDVSTFSVRTAQPSDLLTAEDRIAAEQTFNLLPVGPLSIAAAHLAEARLGLLRHLRLLSRAVRRSSPGVRSRLWAFFYFNEAMILRRQCRRLGITHIHAVQFADGAGDVALLAADGAGLGGKNWRVSISVHGPGELFDVSRYGLPQKVRLADFVTVPAEFTRSQLLALVEETYASHVHVVHMGVEPERFPACPESGRSGSEARVLCVARLVRHKGHATLLRALASLRGQGLALRTTLIGEGPERRALEQLRDELGLQSLVRFKGVAGQDELPAAYAEADIFCLPTLAETVGVVNMEAMASARAVVSSRLMGVPELIEDGVCGLLVTPGRENELAAALRRLAEDPGLRERLATAGRQRVLEHFDSRRQAKRLKQLLCEP